jgi:hypothetical protein
MQENQEEPNNQENPALNLPKPDYAEGKTKLLELENNLIKLKSDLERQLGLQRQVSEAEDAVAKEKKKLEQDHRGEINKEKNELLKETLQECKPYFKCPKCSQDVEITNVKTDLTDMSRKFLLEAQCPNPKCENSKIMHPENQECAKPLLHCWLQEGPSKYKLLTRGYA